MNLSAIETKFTCRNLKANPLTRRRQITDVQAARRIRLTFTNLICSPVRSMFPVFSVMELQHDSFGRLIRRQIHIRIEALAWQQFKSDWSVLKSMCVNASCRHVRVTLLSESHIIPSPIAVACRPRWHLVREPYACLPIRHIDKPMTLFKQFNLTFERITVDIDHELDRTLNRPRDVGRLWWSQKRFSDAHVCRVVKCGLQSDNPRTVEHGDDMFFTPCSSTVDAIRKMVLKTGEFKERPITF